MTENPPVVGGTDADGPRVEYVLEVTYPNDGGRVSESGRDRAAVIARRLRREADELDRLVPPADPVGTVRRSPEGVVAVKRGDWPHSWRGSDGYDHDHDDVAGWVRLVPEVLDTEKAALAGSRFYVERHDTDDPSLFGWKVMDRDGEFLPYVFPTRDQADERAAEAEGKFGRPAAAVTPRGGELS